VVKIPVMPNLLYIHGLDGNLSVEKQHVLEKHGSIIAPHLDYRANPGTYSDLLEIAKDEKIDFLIGSSMGGCMAYHLSLHLQLPALLFNPALPFRSVGIDLPLQDKVRQSYLCVVIGGQDDIVPPIQNFHWITAHEKGEMDIRWRNTLGHRIPLDVFEEEIDGFFRR
jgi:hypothetical protein